MEDEEADDGDRSDEDSDDGTEDDSEAEDDSEDNSDDSDYDADDDEDIEVEPDTARTHPSPNLSLRTRIFQRWRPRLRRSRAGAH